MLYGNRVLHRSHSSDKSTNEYDAKGYCHRRGAHAKVNQHLVRPVDNHEFHRKPQPEVATT